MKKNLLHSKAFLFLLFAFLPYLLYGFTYYPALDDYIQYWCYAQRDLSYVYTGIGTLATRPLAGLLDPTFWASFWPVSGLALVLITGMHFFSCVFFAKTAENVHSKLSPLFWLIYLCAPLGMEGRFWLSAATRIICGMFFASFSLYFASRFLTREKDKKSLLLFAFFQLISCGFYESVAIFSVSAAVLISLMAVKPFHNKKWWQVSVISVVNIVLMFTYYRVFATLGKMGSRAQGLNLGNLLSNLGQEAIQVGEIFAQTVNRLFIGSFRGLTILFSSFLGVFLLCLGLLLCFFLCRHIKGQKALSFSRGFIFFAFGLILFAAPLVANCLSEPVWLTYRSMFVPLIGLALMAEPLFSLLKRKGIKQIVFFLLAFLCLTANVNEYDTYRRNYEQDSVLLKQVAAELDEEVLAGEKGAIVLLPKEVKVSQTAFYKDHVKSVFDSDWALIGALREKTKNMNINHIYPVIEGTPLPQGDFQMIVIDKLP